MPMLEDYEEGYINDTQYKEVPPIDYGTDDPVEARLENLWAVEDVVNSPKHYKFGGLELIDIIDAMLSDDRFTPQEGFYIATILQYIIRFPQKNGVQDLNKARFYLDRLIKIKGREED